MAIDTVTPTSRRVLLAGALGGLAALAGSAFGRPSPVRATNGDPILVGHTYTATTVTEIDATGAPAIRGTSDSSVGVWGSSTSASGVAGVSSTYYGVVGSSTSSYGVFASSHTGAAVYGNSLTNTGVQGYSGFQSVPVPAKTGVHGYADQDGSAIGVNGQTTLGHGVFGVATTGIGVHGKADTGRGGQFAGGKAQLRLVPSAATTHPSSGAAGDLFLDKNKRLWFCKGGTTWKQLA